MALLLEKKIFKENLELFGKRGVDKSDCAFTTCRKYGFDKTVKLTKSKKPLNNNLRENYRGIYYGLFFAFEEYERNAEKNKK